MKALIFFMLCVVVMTTARPVFAKEPKPEYTPADVRDWILAFMQGYDVYKYANATKECIDDGGVLLNFASAGFDNYINHHYYEGSLNISDALGEMSELSRDCYETTEQLEDALDQYMHRFTDVSDFIQQVSINAMSHVKPIQAKGKEILLEYLTTYNITHMSELTGEIANLVFIFDEEAPRKSSNFEASPAPPVAMNQYVWLVFESLYEFGIKSRLVSTPTLQKCQEAILNMAVYDEKALNYWRNGDKKNAQFAFADSLTFSHDIVDGCYHTGKEVGATWGKVKEQIIDQGKIGENVEKNLFEIISSTTTVWSQIWHEDVINLTGALGSIFYRVLVFGTN